MLHHKGLFPIEKLSKTYPVADIAQAFADLRSGTVIKPIISWGGV